MQLLNTPTESPSALTAAREVLETLPMVMRAIRAELRERPAGLSEAQFRTVFFLHHHRGASLSDVAEFHGLTPPSTSRLIEGLVARGVVAREVAAGDRRRLTLTLTAKGRAVLQVKMAATRDRLAGHLEAMAPEERVIVVAAMDALRRALASAHKAQEHTRHRPLEAHS